MRAKPNSDLNRLAAEGLELAFDSGVDFYDPAEIAWALTRNAARVISTWDRPGPAGYPQRSPMPDPVRPRREIREVERERFFERVQVETEVRWTPSAREHDRADELSYLWHPQNFVGMSRDPQASCRAVWLKAAGVSDRRIRAITDVSRTRAYDFRRRACLSIGRFLIPCLEELRGMSNIPEFQKSA